VGERDARGRFGPGNGFVNKPASGMPASGYRWPPFEPGNMASLQHGAASNRVLSPIAERLREALARDAPWTAAPAFAAVLEAWSWMEARCQVYRQHFDAVGHVGEDGNPRRGLERWDRAEARAQSLRNELGLTPLSLSKLLARASSVARQVNDDRALEALLSEGARIMEARAARELEGSDG
jgi:hypothetical protein